MLLEEFFTGRTLGRIWNVDEILKILSFYCWWCSWTFLFILLFVLSEGVGRKILSLCEWNRKRENWVGVFFIIFENLGGWSRRRSGEPYVRRSLLGLVACFFLRPLLPRDLLRRDRRNRLDNDLLSDWMRIPSFRSDALLSLRELLTYLENWKNIFFKN